MGATIFLSAKLGKYLIPYLITKNYLQLLWQFLE